MSSTDAASRQKHTAGIVTITYRHNYGCTLQNYALQKTLQRFGLRAESVIFDPSRACKKSLARAFSCKKTLHSVRNIPNRIFYNLFERKTKKLRRKLFEDFGRRFLTKTRSLDSYEEVVREGERFDVLIAGSDQVWNTTWYDNETFFKYHMLDFVPSEKKISYAASLGLSQLPEEVVPRFQKYLSDFSWISVRENEGARELKKILNRPVDVTLDPTMLLSAEEWDAVVKQYSTDQIQTPPYVFCYSLGNKEGVIRKARQIQKYCKAPVLYLCGTVFEDWSIKLKRPYVKPVLKVDPGEFISLLKNSACVVTDSFHGSVFSVLFHKPFFTMMRDKADPRRSMNSRMSTLFSTFRLESRLFSPEDDAPLTPESFEIDYEAVDKILQERREFSLRKLQESLENVLHEKFEA